MSLLPTPKPDCHFENTWKAPQLINKQRGREKNRCSRAKSLAQIKQTRTNSWITFTVRRAGEQIISAHFCVAFTATQQQQVGRADNLPLTSNISWTTDLLINLHLFTPRSRCTGRGNEIAVMPAIYLLWSIQWAGRSCLFACKTD